MVPMADNTTRPATRGRRWASRWKSHRGMLAGVAGLSVLLCAGAGISSAASPGAKRIDAELAYARCMRAHGVTNFPDPDPQGNLPPFQPSVSAQTAAPAYSACKHLLLSGGGSGPATRGDQQKLAFALKTAQCMRRHGYPTYPDPPSPSASSQGSGNRFDGTGIDTKAPRFLTTETACETQARRELGLPPAGSN